jgi:hypothetical protein
MRALFLILTPLVTAAIGWFLAPNRGDIVSDSADSTKSSRRVTPSRSASHSEKSDLGELGSFRVLENGQRIYSGPRDSRVLKQMARVNPKDFGGFSEMMSQLSQMNDGELADAWTELSRQAPREGMGSV